MEPYVGEIRVFSYHNIPTGFLPCDGRTLNINGNQALFALLGITYGGDGRVNFKLPDLRGAAMLDVKPGTYNLGVVGGAENVALIIANAPNVPHAHGFGGQTAAATTSLNNVAPLEILAQPGPPPTLATATINTYLPAPQVKTLVQLIPATIGTTGGAAHDNMSPFLTLNVCIAITGIFPPRN